MLTLRQLRYFEAVARLGHFGQAADHCAVTQPALSMQIKQLEEELGLVLIERRSRGIQLTAEGAEVLNRARRILAEAQDLTDFARHRANPLGGPLRLGVIPTIAPYLLPRLLPALTQQFPALQPVIVESQTERLTQRLLEGELDLLLLALPLEPAEIETRALATDPFVLAVPQGHRLASADAASNADLLAERLLLLEEGHCLRDQALAFCGSRPESPQDAFGATSLATIVQLVANGMGVTLLPQLSLAVEGVHPGIRTIPFGHPQPERTIGLAWRASSPRKPAFEAIAAAIGPAVSQPVAAAAGAPSDPVPGREPAG